MVVSRYFACSIRLVMTSDIGLTPKKSLYKCWKQERLMVNSWASPSMVQFRKGWL
ncbi:hypothetical protein ACFTAO_33740 [Paenibacillus rhizoplanae]